MGCALLESCFICFFTGADFGFYLMNDSSCLRAVSLSYWRGLGGLVAVSSNSVIVAKLDEKRVGRAKWGTFPSPFLLFATWAPTHANYKICVCYAYLRNDGLNCFVILYE